MNDLNFALFNLTDMEKMGLAFRKIFLNRLTPLFFAPRIERLIKVTCLNSRGYNIVLPMGPETFKALNPDKLEIMINRTISLAEKQNLYCMAVDRRLKDLFSPTEGNISIVYGDDFIKALAYVLIERIISKHGAERLVIVGEAEKLQDFITEVVEFNLPVSMQSLQAVKNEIFSYHMLYKYGYAVSNSHINPDGWDTGDIVVAFDQVNHKMVLANSDIKLLEFNNESYNLAPDIEHDVSNCGINSNLYNLAPILETCLLSKEGLLAEDEEQINTKYAPYKGFMRLREIGYELGLWDVFLDNSY